MFRHTLGVLDRALQAIKDALSVNDGDVDVADGVLKEKGVRVAKIATGTYTGDGTTSKSITGLGFRPKFVRTVGRETSDGTTVNIFETTDTIVDDAGSGGSLLHITGGGHDFRTDRIVSLDSDGFTVSDEGGDSHPNKDGTEYNWMAIG